MDWDNRVAVAIAYLNKLVSPDWFETKSDDFIWASLNAVIAKVPSL